MDRKWWKLEESQYESGLLEVKLKLFIQAWKVNMQGWGIHSTLFVRRDGTWYCECPEWSMPRRILLNSLIAKNELDYSELSESTKKALIKIFKVNVDSDKGSYRHWSEYE